MTQKQLATRLHKALLENGEMAQALYAFDLEEHIDYWYEGLKRDRDEFVFVVTEHSGDVAMVLIDADKTLYINEAGRQKLMELWPLGYERNIKRLIPVMVQNLLNGCIFVTGVKTVDPAKLSNARKRWTWRK